MIYISTNEPQGQYRYYNHQVQDFHPIQSRLHLQPSHENQPSLQGQGFQQGTNHHLLLPHTSSFDLVH